MGEITGVGGNAGATGYTNTGVSLDQGTSLQTDSGDITITGSTIGGTNSNIGIFGNREFDLIASGAITLRGTGSGTGGSNLGVDIVDAGTISAGTSLLIEGTATQDLTASGSSNTGVELAFSTLGAGSDATIRGPSRDQYIG